MRSVGAPAQMPGTAKDERCRGDLPDYYAQDFHFQTGGYLTERSAKLYDVQVERCSWARPARCGGGAGADRRVHARARPTQVALLDVACGTGRFLRQVRLAFPAMALKGLDLSRALSRRGAQAPRRACAAPR